MSNKAQKRGLVPKLRFPEFRDAEEWTNALLGKLLIGSPDYGVNAAAIPFADNLPKYLRITDISEDGQYLPDKQVSVDLDATDENYLDEGDIVLARTGASVGKSYRYRKEDGKLVFAGFLIRVKPDPRLLISTYLANFLTTDQFWKWIAVTSARSGQPGVNSTEYSSLAIPLPPKFSEQQKIADCLASLDERITLEAQKLDTLKTHKKGLMQQLFPAEGETLPKLRFPEFRDTGEWKFVPLKELASRRTERNSDGKLVRVLTNSAEHGVVDQRDYFDKDIATQGNLENYFIVDSGDFVYNPRISTFAPVGPISRNRVAKGVMSPLYTVFRFKNSGIDFYAHYFKTSAWHLYMRQVGSTGARHDRMAIANDDFLAMPLPAPSPEEQQKIADCFTSIDDLITAQTQKLAALKTHKKGLLQQLFPVLNEVPA
jgi:type I restriction enzyme S subunit